MPIAKPKPRVAKKKPSKKVVKKKKPVQRAAAPKKAQPKKAPQPKKEKKNVAKPISLAVMLFEMQMHSVSKILLTDKQRKLLGKKIDRHRDLIKKSCKNFLDQPIAKRELGIRTLAVIFFMKVSKKNKTNIQQVVKKSFKTF